MSKPGMMSALSALAVGPVLLAASPVAAQAVGDRYWLQGGLFHAVVDSRVQISGSSGEIGTELDFETDLALNRQRYLPTFSGGIRFSRRWSLNADAYTLKRSGVLDINDEIIVDDVTHPIGAEVRSGFKSSTLRLAAGYSLFRGDNYDIGATLGLHLTSFDVSIVGEVSVDDESVSSETNQRDLLAPLPTIGVHAIFSPIPRVTLMARVDYLRLKISDYTGALVNAEAGFSWRVHPNFGIGAKYRHVDYSLDVESDDWKGGVGYKFSGPFVFAEIGF